LNVDRARPYTGAANFVAAIPANTTASRTRRGRAIPYVLIVIVSVLVCDVFYWILHFGVVVGDACAVSSVFIQCFRELIDGVNPFHDRGLDSFLDLLVGRIFRVLMRSGNAITTTLLDAVAQYC
jgi:hypothetical protein